MRVGQQSNFKHAASDGLRDAQRLRTDVTFYKDIAAPTESRKFSELVPAVLHSLPRLSEYPLRYFSEQKANRGPISCDITFQTRSNIKDHKWL
jgi:hypothetical protein